jgi:sugar phosphate isomerase/epimerase
MEISTSLSYFINRSDRDAFPEGTFIRILRMAYDAGFRTVDAPLCHEYEEFITSKDNWEYVIKELKEEADKLGMAFNQSHLPYYQFLSSSPSEFEYHEENIRRGIIASGILGIKWGVIHPCGRISGRDWSSGKELLEKNIEYFKPKLELVAQNNTGIAIENTGHQYCSHEEELMELVSALKDPRIGICWDFGHANLSKLDQEKSLRNIGDLLKALHVDDNGSWNDNHYLPFQGNVPWQRLMQVLREIGYKGDMTLEVNPPYNCADDFIMAMGIHSYKAAEYLIKCFNKS